MPPRAHRRGGGAAGGSEAGPKGGLEVGLGAGLSGEAEEATGAMEAIVLMEAEAEAEEEEKEEEKEGVADEPCTRLVLLQTKALLFLLREEEEQEAAVEEGAVAEEVSAAAGSDGGADGVCVPSWIFGWERRAFSFSSALDPMVAIAAVNLALLCHRGRTGAPGAPDAPGALIAPGAFGASGLTGASGATGAIGAGSSPDAPSHGGDPLWRGGLRLYDPCCGSGTVLAAAAALGCTRLYGADLRALTPDSHPELTPGPHPIIPPLSHPYP